MSVKTYSKPTLTKLTPGEPDFVATLNKLDVKQTAQFLINAGYCVVPLKPKSKEYRDASAAFPTLVYTADMFEDDENIGLRSLNGIVVVDVDSKEAVKLADYFLPKTEMIWERESKPRAKRVYRSKGFEGVIKYSDLDKPDDDATKSLVELRANHQDVLPPSIHDQGEKLRWVRYGKPTEEEHDKLLKVVRMLSTSALVARYYPGLGDRHEYCKSLAGFFRQIEIAEIDTSEIVLRAAAVAGDDEVNDRATALADTFKKEDGEPLQGETWLKENISEKFVRSVRKIWGALRLKRGFICNEKGYIIANNPDNILRGLEKLSLHPFRDEFSGSWFVASGENIARVPHRLNYEQLFTGTGGVWRVEDEMLHRLWMEFYSKFKFQPGIDKMTIVIKDTANRNPVHPVLDYLDSLEWDKTPRIDKWLITYGGAINTEYVRAVSAIFLIAAVRRVRQPGCKFDEMLILESGQGLNKSTAIESLCPNKDWFSDDLPLGVDAKEVIERTKGMWIIEAADLHGQKGKQPEHLKSFLSRQVDVARLAYGKLAAYVPRQFILCGSSNPNMYLKDSTGGRRYWPVRVKMFDIEGIKQDRDQLWAEAAHREASGEPIRLAEELWGVAGKEQELRRVEDPWEELIQHGLDSDRYRVKKPDGSVKSNEKRVTNDELWDIVNVPKERRDQEMLSRLAAVMQRLGFRRMTVSRPEKKYKGWGNTESTQLELK